MANYSRQIASARAKIADKGELCTYMPVVPSVLPNNPAQPWKVGTAAVPDINAAPATTPVHIVFLDAKARGSSTQGMAAEFTEKTTIVAGNKSALIAGGQGIVPKVGDKIQRSNGDVVSVSKIKTLAPSGVDILYTCEIEL